MYLVSQSLQSLGLTLMLSFLASCGGDGSTSNSSQAAQSQNQVSGNQSIKIDYAASVSLATKLAVTKVLSPAGGDGAPNGEVLVPDPTKVPSSMVLAFDANGRIRLATMSALKEFSADSTALTLVHWMLAAELSALSHADMSSLIRTTAPYSGLVAAVQAVLDGGSSVMEDPVVLTSLALTVQAAMTATSKKNSLTSSHKLQTKGVANPRVTEPGVFAAFVAAKSSFLAIPMQIELSNTGITKGIRVTNTTPLYWVAKTTKQDGSPLAVLTSSASLSEGAAIVPPASLGTSVISAIPLLGRLKDKPFIDLADTPEEGYNITIAQNKDTKASNNRTVYYAMSKSFFALANLSDEEKCYAGMVDFGVKAGVLTLVDGETLEDFTTGMKRLVSANGDMYSTCSSALGEPIGEFKKSLKTFAEVALPQFMTLYEGYEKVVKGLGIAENALIAVATVQMMSEFNGSPKTYGVCAKSINGLRSEILTCIKTLKFDDVIDPYSKAAVEDPSLLVGSTLAFTLRGTNESGNITTYFPSSIQPKMALAGVLDVNLETNQFQANAVGFGGFDMYDMATDISTPMILRVVDSGNVVAEKTEVAIGELTRVRLIDTWGRSIFVAGSQLQWSSSAPDIADVLSSVAYPFVSVVAKKASQIPVTISATLAGKTISSVQIQIAEKPTLNFLAAQCSYTTTIPCNQSGACGTPTKDDIYTAANINAKIAASGPVGTRVQNSRVLKYSGDWALFQCGGWTRIEGKMNVGGVSGNLQDMCVREAGQPSTTIIDSSLGILVAFGNTIPPTSLNLDWTLSAYAGDAASASTRQFCAH